MIQSPGPIRNRMPLLAKDVNQSIRSIVGIPISALPPRKEVKTGQEAQSMLTQDATDPVGRSKLMRTLRSKMSTLRILPSWILRSSKRLKPLPARCPNQVRRYRYIYWMRCLPLTSTTKAMGIVKVQDMRETTWRRIDRRR